jgi:DNA-nicking Smr family endonuclease
MGAILSSPTSKATLPSTLIRAEALRSEANSLIAKAKDVSERSQSEYHTGSRAKAKELSNEKSALYDQAKRKHTQAAHFFFEHYNADRPLDTIDLHGLHVKEALDYVEKRIDTCRSSNIAQLTVITGMGNNSAGGIAKLKPAVEKFIHDKQLNITIEDGHVLIDLRGPSHGSFHPIMDRCVIQ